MTTENDLRSIQLVDSLGRLKIESVYGEVTAAYEATRVAKANMLAEL